MKQTLFAFAIALSACGTQPAIVNTTVEPSAFKISGLVNTAQFTLTTDVLHLGGTVTKVTAAVEGKDLKFDLVKSGNIAGGERWQITAQLTLWTGFSTGVYYINVVATDSNGTSVTATHAASVTITD